MNEKSPEFIKDLVYVLVVSIAAYFVSSSLDMLETIVEFSRKYEKYEIDEIISVVLFVFMFSLVVFSYRRWRESRHLSKLLYQRNDQIMHALNETKTIYADFKDTAQVKMIQQDKMSSIGLLAAGVAQEIKNPIDFISSNLFMISKYIERLPEEISSEKKSNKSECIKEQEGLIKKPKIDFSTQDVNDLINESLVSADQVSKIVEGLKTFSLVDDTDHKQADINECMENTLNWVWHELKHKATINKDLGDLPLTKCYPQKLNQVFMNILVNASHAIEGKGEIGIKTWQQNDCIVVSISDSGSGISEENLNKIFEPFFTTKSIDKGTGFGLSSSYEIIQKHKGNIVVNSEIGRGTIFTINIPIVEG